MVWRSGRVAGTVRKVAIVCFYGLLRRGYADRKALFQVGACFCSTCAPYYVFYERRGSDEVRV